MKCNCKVPGPNKGCHCRSETYGFHFASDDWCNCNCHFPSDQEMWCYNCCKMLPCRWSPSPDAGPFWRCSECSETIED